MGLALPVPHYTIEDYLQWEGRWELWEGHPVAMAPSPNRRHQGLNGKLHRLLANQLEEKDCQDCELFFEIDWHVNNDTVVRPDLLLVCDEDDKDFDFIRKRPDFIAEILSPGNSQNDLLVKRTLYESQGVPTYLILDPQDATRHLLLKLSEKGTYEESDDWSFTPHSECHLTLPDELRV